MCTSASSIQYMNRNWGSCAPLETPPGAPKTIFANFYYAFTTPGKGRRKANMKAPWFNHQYLHFFRVRVLLRPLLRLTAPDTNLAALV